LTGEAGSGEERLHCRWEAEGKNYNLKVLQKGEAALAIAGTGDVGRGLHRNSFLSQMETRRPPSYWCPEPRLYSVNSKIAIIRDN
jgi:hypothetical protein